MGKFDINSLNSIEGAYKKARSLAIIFIVVSLILCVAVTFLAYQFAESQREKIYVINAKGNAVEFALRSDPTANRAAEVKHQMKMFHEAFYTLTPDIDQIKYNQSIALNLGDHSLSKLKDIYLEQGYFNDIVRQKIFSHVKIDSIVVSTDIYPYQAIFYGKNILTRPTSELVKSLITKCRMSDVARSNQNPHGLLIENFEVFQNKTIDEYKR